MPHKCFNCSSKSGNLHRLPTTAEFRNKWLNVIPGVTLSDFTPNFRLCSLHFDDKYLTLNGGITRNAVPSKFLLDNKWVANMQKVLSDRPGEAASINQSEIAFEYIEIKQEPSNCLPNDDQQALLESSKSIPTNNALEPVPEIISEPGDNPSVASATRGLKRKTHGDRTCHIPTKECYKPAMINQISQTEEYDIVKAIPERQDELIESLKRQIEQLKECLTANQTPNHFGKIPIESLRGQNLKVRYLTGFPNFVTMEIMYKDVENFIPFTVGGKMSKFDVILMTWVKLKLDLPLNYLSIVMHISTSTISRLFYETFFILYGRLSGYIVWPNHTNNRDNLITDHIQIFGDRRIIVVDCFDFFSEQTDYHNINNLTSDSKQQKDSDQTNQKSQHGLVKYLMCFSTAGTIIYLSKPFDKGSSKRCVAQESGVFDMVERDDVILADREFIYKSVDKQNSNDLVPMVRNIEGELVEMALEITNEITKIREDIVKRILYTKQRIKNLTNRPPILDVTNKYGKEIYFDFIIKMACSIVNLTPTQETDIEVLENEK